MPPFFQIVRQGKGAGSASSPLAYAHRPRFPFKPYSRHNLEFRCLSRAHSRFAASNSGPSSQPLASNSSSSLKAASSATCISSVHLAHMPDCRLRCTPIAPHIGQTSSLRRLHRILLACTSMERLERSTPNRRFISAWTASTPKCPISRSSSSWPVVHELTAAHRPSSRAYRPRPARTRPVSTS